MSEEATLYLTILLCLFAWALSGFLTFVFIGKFIYRESLTVRNLFQAAHIGLICGPFVIVFFGAYHLEKWLKEKGYLDKEVL